MEQPGLTLHIQRMHADRITVTVPLSASVDDLRIQIRLVTSVPDDRQRIIFRGRVLKNGDELRQYGIENGSVLHLVERSATSPLISSSEQPPQSNVARAGVMFHSVEVDPAMGPASIASQITQSLLGAFSNVFAPTSTTSPSGGPPPPPSAATDTSPIIITSPPMMPSSSRITSRPTRPPTAEVSSHSLIRMETTRALGSLSEELARVTCFADGSELFPAIQPVEDMIPNSNGNDALLRQSFEQFERAYLMMANGCRELREGLSAEGSIPWDRLHNLVSILQELPLLMIVQRRLLSSLRARPNPADPLHPHLELPTNLDVPSFLLPREPPQPTSPDFTDIIDPPE